MHESLFVALSRVENNLCEMCRKGHTFSKQFYGPCYKWHTLPLIKDYNGHRSYFLRNTIIKIIINMLSDIFIMCILHIKTMF